MKIASLLRQFFVSFSNLPGKKAKSFSVTSCTWDAEYEILLTEQQTLFDTFLGYFYGFGVVSVS